METAIKNQNGFLQKLERENKASIRKVIEMCLEEAKPEELSKFIGWKGFWVRIRLLFC
ncbi:MAG: hypothetical protein QG641_1952 [Candidatus Poribacteria bacterium]|nr:hypothetical protein [Candidatus Poribacteria bacterium]